MDNLLTGKARRTRAFADQMKGRSGVASSQGDLFKFDSPLHGDVRGERSIMAFPFFALTKVAQMKPIEYHSENVSIEVRPRSEEHTSELQSLMRNSYGVFCLKKKNNI